MTDTPPRPRYGSGLYAQWSSSAASRSRPRRCRPRRPASASSSSGSRSQTWLPAGGAHAAARGIVGNRVRPSSSTLVTACGPRPRARRRLRRRTAAAHHRDQRPRGGPRAARPHRAHERAGSADADRNPDRLLGRAAAEFRPARTRHRARAPACGPSTTADVLTEERFGWFAAPSWQHRAGEPLPLATMAEPCGVRALANAAA